MWLRRRSPASSSSASKPGKALGKWCRFTFRSQTVRTIFGRLYPPRSSRLTRLVNASRLFRLTRPHVRQATPANCKERCKAARSAEWEEARWVPRLERSPELAAILVADGVSTHQVLAHYSVLASAER